MKRYEMIKDSEYFKKIIKCGTFVKNNYFVIYFVLNNTKKSKFGIAVKNKLGNAVVRNHIKRQIRSIIDINRKLFQNDRDYIIMLRDDSVRAKYDELNNSFVDLLKGIKYDKK